MAILRLERSDWDCFCIRVSRAFLGKQADIEVGSVQIGFHLKARRLPLRGMSYDSGSDMLQLLVGESRHVIRAPRELYVDEEPLGLIIFQVIDADDVRQIITLHEPLRLPAQ